VSEALDLAKARIARTHTLILKVVSDLSDEQLGAHSSPRAHSIGWTLWHIARCADKFAAEVEGGKEIWATEDLARTWGLGRDLMGTNGAGTGADDLVAAGLRPPSKDVLLDYTKRAFAAVEGFAQRLDDAGLDREFESFFAEGPTSVGNALFTCLTHDNRHLGELEFIKGLLGQRGTATR